jgi:hypothetical protein
LTTLHFIFTRLFKAVSSGPRHVVLNPAIHRGIARAHHSFTGDCTMAKKKKAKKKAAKKKK